MKSYIYLIRHGEVDNPEGIFYGRLPNFHLSEKGRREIQASAEFLADKKIVALFSSPMTRARESTAIIRKRLGLGPYEVSKRLWEIRSSFEGTKFSDLSPDQSEIYNSSKRIRTDEGVEQLAHRMMGFILAETHNFEGQHIAAVSHGDTIMSVRAAINNLPLEFPSIRIPPYIQHGEVTEITIEGNESTIKSVFIPKVK